jgi:hypothetical protein
VPFLQLMAITEAIRAALLMLGAVLAAAVTSVATFQWCSGLMLLVSVAVTAWFCSPFTLAPEFRHWKLVGAGMALKLVSREYIPSSSLALSRWG